MPRPEIFMDSSALFPGLVSAHGAAHALPLLSEARQITVIVSQQVVAETERAVARKFPRALPYYRDALRSTGVRIVRDPSLEEIETHADIIADLTDVPIVVAAMKARVNYLVTFNRRHFLDDPDVTTRSGLRIGLPQDALAWIRDNLPPMPKNA